MTIESELKRIADILEVLAAGVTGVKIVQPELPLDKLPEAPAAEKKKPGRKSKPPAGESLTDRDLDLPLEQKESPSKFTKEQLRAALQNLPDRETGLDILAKFKAPTLSALKESDYDAVMLMIDQVIDNV